MARRSATYTVVLNVGNVTSVQLSLPGPQRYCFAVRAYDNLGLTCSYSTEVVFDVPSPVPPARADQPFAERGRVGTFVTIVGTNFGASQGTSQVTFNGDSGADELVGDEALSCRCRRAP